MKMARSGKSTTLDSVLTLIDTISNRLQLLSHDYRGSDALKLELALLHTILLCIAHLRSNLFSILLNLSDELRHFYLLLRSERRLVYVMVEEISRFRETLKIFQRQFCESNSTCLLDLVLDKLQPLVPENPRGDDEDLGKLKVELNLIKLLNLCGRNQASHEFRLSEIMSAIYEDATQFYYLALMFEDSSPNHELAECLSSLRAALLKCCTFQQETSEMCSLLQSDGDFVWPFSQLSGFYNSLLENLWDIYFWGQCYPMVYWFIRPLINAMTFLKCFIRLATWQINTPDLVIESFLNHCQVLAISAACLAYMCWFLREVDDQEVLQFKCCELVEKVWPGPRNIQFTQMCIETLATSRKSRAPDVFMRKEDWLVVSDFVGYLFQTVDRACPVLSLDQTKKLNDSLHLMQIRVNMLDRDGRKFIGLRFFDVNFNFKYDIEGSRKDEYRLHEAGLINSAVEATVIVFQLYMLGRKDKLPEEISQFLGSTTSFRTCINWILAKTSSQTSFPRLIVNGAVVSYGVRSIEHIKYQLLKNSTKLDLIAIVEAWAGKQVARFADMICYDSEVINHFKVRASCFYRAGGNNRTRKLMLQQVLASILSKSSEEHAESPETSETSEDRLAQQVYDCLKGKRYLIILNGVSRFQAWRDLVSWFPRDDNQSKILLTSSSIFHPGYFSLEPNCSI